MKHDSDGAPDVVEHAADRIDPVELRERAGSCRCPAATVASPKIVCVSPTTRPGCSEEDGSATRRVPPRRTQSSTALRWSSVRSSRSSTAVVELVDRRRDRHVAAELSEREHERLRPQRTRSREGRVGRRRPEGRPQRARPRRDRVPSSSQKTIVLRFTRSPSRARVRQRTEASVSSGPVGRVAVPHLVEQERSRRRTAATRPGTARAMSAPLLAGRLARHVVEKRRCPRAPRPTRGTGTATRRATGLRLRAEPPRGRHSSAVRPRPVRTRAAAGVGASRLHALAEPEEHHDDQHDRGDEDHARDEAAPGDAADRVEHSADGLGDPSLDPLDDRRSGTVELGPRDSTSCAGVLRLRARVCRPGAGRLQSTGQAATRSNRSATASSRSSPSSRMRRSR